MPMIENELTLLAQTIQAERAQQPAPSTWRPIETAPAGVPLVVGWLDSDDAEDPERHDFDMLEDGVWRVWGETVERAELCAPPGSRMPAEQAPYSFWMALPPLPR